MNVRETGFTLIEILVAVAVLAIALGALIRGTGATASNAEHLRDKTFAHWVAMNRVAEQQLNPAWPGTGRSNGVAEMAGREWPWEQVVGTTPDGEIRRLTVRVSNAPDAEPLVKLVAYLARPAG